eukprot:21501-Heterococcus_DN1.PRE.4
MMLLLLLLLFDHVIISARTSACSKEDASISCCSAATQHNCLQAASSSAANTKSTAALVHMPSLLHAVCVCLLAAAFCYAAAGCCDRHVLHATVQNLQHERATVQRLKAKANALGKLVRACEAREALTDKLLSSVGLLCCACAAKQCGQQNAFETQASVSQLGSTPQCDSSSG